MRTLVLWFLVEDIHHKNMDFAVHIRTVLLWFPGFFPLWKEEIKLAWCVCFALLWQREGKCTCRTKWSCRIPQRILHPDTSGPKESWHRSCTSDQAGSWYKWSKRIRAQRSPTVGPTGACEGSWRKRFQGILKQRSCTSGPTGSWYKWATTVLTRGSWDRGLAQVVLQNPDTNGPQGSWHGHPETEILHKCCYRIR